MCDWEVLISILVSLSAKSGVAGVEIEYMLVKDYCQKYEFDVVDTFSIVKRIALSVWAKD